MDHQQVWLALDHPRQDGSPRPGKCFTCTECQQRSCGCKGKSEVREKSKAWLLVAGVLKFTIKLHSKLIFKVLFPLEMVKTQCEVSCPYLSAQQSIIHHCIKPDGSGELHPAHTDSNSFTLRQRHLNKQSSFTLLHLLNQHSTRARPGC